MSKPSYWLRLNASGRRVLFSTPFHFLSDRKQGAVFLYKFGFTTGKRKSLLAKVSLWLSNYKQLPGTANQHYMYQIYRRQKKQSTRSVCSLCVCLCCPVDIVTCLYSLCLSSVIVIIISIEKLVLTVSIILAAIGQLELARKSPSFPMTTWRGSNEAEMSGSVTVDTASIMTTTEFSNKVSGLFSQWFRIRCTTQTCWCLMMITEVHTWNDHIWQTLHPFCSSWHVKLKQFKGSRMEDSFSHTQQSCCIASLQPRELKTTHVCYLSLALNPVEQ